MILVPLVPILELPLPSGTVPEVSFPLYLRNRNNLESNQVRVRRVNELSSNNFIPRRPDLEVKFGVHGLWIQYHLTYHQKMVCRDHDDFLEIKFPHPEELITPVLNRSVSKIRLPYQLHYSPRPLFSLYIPEDLIRERLICVV